MVGQTNNIKELLSQLYTEEGRAHVIRALAERGNVSKEYVERTVDFWERKGELEKAHDLAQKAGMQQRASALEAIIEATEQRTEKKDTGCITSEARAIAESIIQQYEQAGESWNAIELSNKAVDAYYLLGQKNKAVDTALEHGLVQKALIIREREKEWMHAAIIAEAHELYERAGINYERAKEYGKAGDSFVAEVGKRKEGRKKSTNPLISLLSLFTNIIPPQDDALLARALKDYIHAEWEESTKQTAAKINNKKLVMRTYEEEGRFQAAEEYAVVVGDVARQNFYKTIDAMVNPERKKREDAKRIILENERKMDALKHEILSDCERVRVRLGAVRGNRLDEQDVDVASIEEMRKIKQRLRTYLNPTGMITLTANLDETVGLYEACHDSAKIVLRKYGVFDCERKEVANLLERRCEKQGVLEANYVKTMRTMYTLYTLISERKKIREMDRETYIKYHTEVEDFVAAMGKIIGYVEKKEARTKGVLETAFEYGAYGLKELAKKGLIESGYFYVKSMIIVPSILALGLFGKCAYVDAQITHHKQTASMYVTNSSAQQQQIEPKNNEHGCGIQR